MCGIAGIKGKFDYSQINALESSILHRGPDNNGKYISFKKNR